MAKFYSQSFVFPYPWDKVAIAICNKNPNPYSQGVLSEDVISTKIIGNKLIITKILMRTSKIPKWAEKIVPSKTVPILEECVIDPINKTYSTTKRNILHQKFMVAKEICDYIPDERDESKTKCIKKAWVESKITGLSTAIKKYGIEKYKQNALNAALGLEAVLERMYPHSTTEPFSGDDNLHTSASHPNDRDHVGNTHQLLILEDQVIRNVKDSRSLPTIDQHLPSPQYMLPILIYTSLKRWMHIGLSIVNSNTRIFLNPGAMLLSCYSIREDSSSSECSDSVNSKTKSWQTTSSNDHPSKFKKLLKFREYFNASATRNNYERKPEKSQGKSVVEQALENSYF